MNQKQRRALPSMLLFLCVGSLLMPAARAQQPAPPPRQDGAHDFDFELGNWKVHVERLANPLASSTTWKHWDGVSHVWKVWNGKANLVELEADGPSGHIEFLPCASTIRDRASGASTMPAAPTADSRRRPSASFATAAASSTIRKLTRVGQSWSAASSPIPVPIPHTLNNPSQPMGPHLGSQLQGEVRAPPQQQHRAMIRQ
jgi:hypothetical protein